MRIQRSDKYNKVRYAGFDGSHRVTQWLPSPADVENQFIGRVREGTVDPRGFDSKMRDSICSELEEYGILSIEINDDLSPAEQLAYSLADMKQQGVPQKTRARFAQIATCTPEADAKWVFQI
jgi:hypothetical protein